LPPLFDKLGGEKFEIAWLDDSQRVRELIMYYDAYNAAEASIKRSTGSKIESGMDGVQAVEEEQEGIEAIDISELWFQTVAASRPSNNQPDVIETAVQIQRLFEDFAEQDLSQPTFITDFPKPLSPLSKGSPNDPAIAERFELFIAGMECANGFSELNDPEEQYQRFKEQTQQRERGDEVAMVMDEDYIRALSYGMPPAAGIGIGIDRFVMLLTNRQSIRDVILFPHLRPERKIGEAVPSGKEET
jgi:lysyl-tRNA synthetase, class II